jgi:hypothetical protein
MKEDDRMCPVFKPISAAVIALIFPLLQNVANAQTDCVAMWHSLPPDQQLCDNDPYGPVVHSMIVWNGALYVGGDFEGTCGDPPLELNNIGKWNGSYWSALDTGVDGHVYAMELVGGNLWVGGSFLSAGGYDVGRMAIWNGITWSQIHTQWDDPPGFRDGSVYKIFWVPGEGV